MLTDEVNLESAREAVQQLAKSQRGRHVMRGLLEWMNDGGLGLDQFNQEAIATLLAVAWGPFPGSVRDLMADALDQVYDG